MAQKTALELVAYYKSLLINQYLNLPKASGTIGALTSLVIMPQTSVQLLSLTGIPSSGSFILSYNGVNTASINWDDDAASLQTKLRAIPGLENILVTGGFSSLAFEISFEGVIPPASLLDVFSNSLVVSSTDISISFTQTDEILPLALQNAFNLIGDNPAVGNQLDILGKYANVSRTGNGFSSVITLDDDDFLKLIKMAIITNSSGSSLYTIQNLLHEFFPNQIYVTDQKNMHMTYLILTGSHDLIELFISEGLLPAPMGVSLTVIYYPVLNFFSFRTYSTPNTTGKPFNTYSDYHMDWPFLSYASAITI